MRKHSGAAAIGDKAGAVDPSTGTMMNIVPRSPSQDCRFMATSNQMEQAGVEVLTQTPELERHIPHVNGASEPEPEAGPEPACLNQLLAMLISDHSKGLMGHAQWLLNDHQMAEDVVQEAFLRAWIHAERLNRTEGSIGGWLYTVVRNLALDRLRSASHRYESVGAEDLDVAQRDHADAVLAEVESMSLLRHLSLEHREVLVHTYLCGRTIQETAHVLGIPAGTVKSRQHYALTNLRSRASVRAGVWAG